MTIFDKLFFSIFSFYKKTYKKKANNIALIYTSALQITTLFLLGCFLAAFFSQMHFDAMSSQKAWIGFILLSIGIHFTNWLKYSGKTRKVLNTKWNKIKTPTYNIYTLLSLPFIAIAFGFLFLQAL